MEVSMKFSTLPLYTKLLGAASHVDFYKVAPTEAAVSSSYQINSWLFKLRKCEWEANLFMADSCWFDLMC